MKIFLSVNVNDCVKNEYFNGYKEFDSEDELMDYLNNNRLNKMKKSIQSDEELKIKVFSIMLNDFKSIYSIMNDFSKEMPYEIMLFWESELEKESLRKKENGFINYSQYLSYDKRVGNLKNLLTDYVRSYLKNEVIYGYFGHGFRKKYHDDIFENEILKINKIEFDGKEFDKYELLGIWLTSTDARHFMDKYGEESYDIFAKMVEASMKNILIMALIFYSENHKGNLKSVMRLYQTINEKTVLIK